MLTKSVFTNCFLLSILHLIVDGICALVIFENLYFDVFENQILIVFLVYNCLAFLFQPFVGLLIDHLKKEKLFLVISTIMLLIGALTRSSFIISAIFLGLGNAFFHIAGGKYVICQTNNDIGFLGFFVSLGAVGLVIGQLYYSDFLLIIFFCLLFIIVIIICLSKNERSKTITSKLNYNRKFIFSLFFLLLIVVFLRSYIGKITPIVVEKTNIFLLFLALSQAFGKFLGGIFSKYFKPILTICLTLGIAIIFLCFGGGNAIIICLGIMFFNCSMPITLYYANKLLKNKEGLAFGLLASVLFPGYALGLINLYDNTAKILVMSLGFISILGVAFIVKKVEKYDRTNYH